MICSHPFESQMSFSDPQQMIKTEDGEMPYGVYRYQEIIDESYIISKVIHTSYVDILDISIRERDRMIELINLLTKYKFGIKRLQIIYPNEHSKGSMIIIEAKKNCKHDVKILSPIFTNI